MARSILSTKRFAYRAADKTFTAEVSELTPNFGFERIYNDSLDMGFTLVSQNTGKEVVYAVQQEMTVDGEVHGWELVPTRESRNQVPGAVGTRVFVWND